MPLRVSLDGSEPQVWSGVFYGIRIGTGADNDIVIAGGTPGVHQHHCTIVHTGSSYRIEMLPAHLVFVDGERAECGQQIFFRNSKRCVLSIGGAPAGAGRNILAPPPEVICIREGEATEPMIVKVDGRPLRNRDRLLELRKIFTAGAWAAAFVLAGILAWLGVDYLADRESRARLAAFETFQQVSEDGTVSVAEVAAAQQSVLQLGLSLPDGSGFEPAGSGWVWQADATHKAIATNIHVVDQIKSCLAAPQACFGEVAAGRRYCAAVRHRLSEDIAVFPECSPEAFQARTARHPDHGRFSVFIGRKGQDLQVPNIYDVAAIDLPPGLQALPGLNLASVPPQAGAEVAVLGFPLEGDGDIARAAEDVTLRTGTIGRVSDPFGIPAPDCNSGDPACSRGDYLIITGAVTQGGESGSAIIDGRAEVVAMTFATFVEPAASDAATSGRRYAGTGKFKALNASLVSELGALAFDDLAADQQHDTGQRRLGWARSFAFAGTEYRTMYLASRGSDECRGAGKPVTAIAGRFSVRTGQADLSDVFGTGGGAIVADRAVTLAPRHGGSAYVIFAKAGSDAPNLVTLKAVHPLSGSRIQSNDLVSTIAAINFRLVPAANASTVDLPLAVFSTQAGPVEVEVVEIRCEGEGET